jgi:hypothetical protein
MVLPAKPFLAETRPQGFKINEFTFSTGRKD